MFTNNFTLPANFCHRYSRPSLSFVLGSQHKKRVVCKAAVMTTKIADPRVGNEAVHEPDRNVRISGVIFRSNWPELARDSSYVAWLCIEDANAYNAMQIEARRTTLGIIIHHRPPIPQHSFRRPQKPKMPSLLLEAYFHN